MTTMSYSCPESKSREWRKGVLDFHTHKRLIWRPEIQAGFFRSVQKLDKMKELVKDSSSDWFCPWQPRSSPDQAGGAAWYLRQQEGIAVPPHLQDRQALKTHRILKILQFLRAQASACIFLNWTVYSFQTQSEFSRGFPLYYVANEQNSISDKGTADKPGSVSNFVPEFLPVHQSDSVAIQ